MKDARRRDHAGQLFHHEVSRLLVLGAAEGLAFAHLVAARAEPW